MFGVFLLETGSKIILRFVECKNELPIFTCLTQLGGTRRALTKRQIKTTCRMTNYVKTFNIVQRAFFAVYPCPILALKCIEKSFVTRSAGVVKPTRVFPTNKLSVN